MGRKTEVLFQKLDKIDEKIDKIDKRVDSVDVTLAGQHESLKDHIRRTELLESQMPAMKKELEDQISPLEKFVNQFKGVGKFFGWLSFIAIIAEAIRVWMTK